MMETQGIPLPAGLIAAALFLVLASVLVPIAAIIRHRASVAAMPGRKLLLAGLATLLLPVASALAVPYLGPLDFFWILSGWRLVLALLMLAVALAIFVSGPLATAAAAACWSLARLQRRVRATQ
jgi:hypothetical protein